MSTKTYKPYLGSGKVYARVVGSAMALAEVGNVSELKLTTDEESKELKNNTGGGGTYAEVKRINGVGVSMVLHDLNQVNLSRALKGTASEVVAGTVTDEVQVAYKGGLCRLAHPGPTAVIVTNTGATVTYVAGTDYEVRGEGVFVLPGTTIADAESINVSYSHADYDVVEALTQSGVELEMAFGGINEADSDKPVLVDLYRVSLGAAKELSLIGDDFASLALEGKLLVDGSKTGAGKSKFFSVKQV